MSLRGACLSILEVELRMGRWPEVIYIYTSDQDPGVYCRADEDSARLCSENRLHHLGLTPAMYPPFVAVHAFPLACRH